MIGTILLFRDEGDRPHCEIALANGDRVALALGIDGLMVTRRAELLFRASPKTVAAICAALMGPKRETGASPLRILAAAVQRIGSAAEVRAAFETAAAEL